MSAWPLVITEQLSISSYNCRSVMAPIQIESYKDGRDIKNIIYTVALLTQSICVRETLLQSST